MKSPDIAALEAAVGHSFAHHDLLQQALTHSSYAREMESARSAPEGHVGDNEQLEFLGDAVLGLITTEELFRRFPMFREGQLSKLRAHLVSERHLIRVAQELQVGHFLRLGRGEEKSGGRNKPALLVDALEAVLAAIYLDGGWEPAQRLVRDRIITPELDRVVHHGSLPVTDNKSALQERMQALGRPQPVYLLVKEQGPEHSKTFTVEVRLPSAENGGPPEFVGRAEGLTKKNAEQEAAGQVLEYLRVAQPSEGRGKRPAGSN